MSSNAHRPLWLWGEVEDAAGLRKASAVLTGLQHSVTRISSPHDLVCLLLTIAVIYHYAHKSKFVLGYNYYVFLVRTLSSCSI